VLNGGKLDLLDELLGDNFIDHNPAPGLSPGRAGVRPKIEALRSAFPDLRSLLEALIGKGALVAARSVWRGTHTGAFQGIAATGKEVQVAATDFYRIEEGRVVEHWDNVDRLGLLRQLGVDP
jgi:steroid delta-isomerase-like uncharacterized protein